MSRDRGGRSDGPLDVAWRLLGLAPGATADDVNTARRLLARRAHPDAGGSVERMQELNDAADRALAAIRAGGVESSGPSRPAPTSRSSGTTPSRRPPTPSGGLRRDHPSFTIEALPAEAFEGLLVATAGLGRVVDDDPPYRLEVVLSDPRPAWCRLELVPDAGASTVSLTTARVPGHAVPDIDEVRDRWIAALNRLDWSDLDVNPRPPS